MLTFFPIGLGSKYTKIIEVFNRCIKSRYPLSYTLGWGKKMGMYFVTWLINCVRKSPCQDNFQMGYSAQIQCPIARIKILKLIQFSNVKHICKMGIMWNLRGSNIHFMVRI
jgi:hypothetical protein